jgi:deazaflavin-dependent oxidoreductase (nitroreductase family)
MTALPRWLPAANRVVKGLNRLGTPLGTIQVLEIPGRRSGRPRSTPVSPFRVDGHWYVIAGVPGADWALNAAAAGRGRLVRGRTARAVRLLEVTDPRLRRVVTRAFPTEVPHGVPFFVRIGLVDGPDPEQFAAVADTVRVFELRDEG